MEFSSKMADTAETHTGKNFFLSNVSNVFPWENNISRTSIMYMMLDFSAVSLKTKYRSNINIKLEL